MSAMLGAIRKLKPSLPAQVVQYFFYAAAHPGLPIVDIGRAIGMSKSASHRAFPALSEEHWDKRYESEKMGLGLLMSTPNPEDARFYAVYLTEKGRLLLEAAEDAMFGPSEPAGHKTVHPRKPDAE
jgi:DNA-binding MarR family transcriptional regulator